MGKLMYGDKTYSSTVEQCTGLKYDNASSGLDAENVQDAIDEISQKMPKIYVGVGEPDDSLGKDGDIYLMIVEE